MAHCPQAKRSRDKAKSRQRGRCFWCDVPMDHAKRGHDFSATADHLIAYSRGGRHNQKNIVAACRLCNTARKDQTIEVWLFRVKFRLSSAGNPAFFDVILSRLAKLGIDITSAIPATAPIPAITSAPDGTNSAPPCEAIPR